MTQRLSYCLQFPGFIGHDVTCTGSAAIPDATSHLDHFGVGVDTSRRVLSVRTCRRSFISATCPETQKKAQRGRKWLRKGAFSVRTEKKEKEKKLGNVGGFAEIAEKMH